MSAQRPYTIYDPFHSSEYYTLKRKATCVGCCHGDFIENANVEMIKGTQVIKVTLSFGPSNRTQHFHPECYVRHLDHVRENLLDDRSKVYPILDPSNVVKFPITRDTREERRIEQACERANYDRSEDDAPFYPADHIPF